MPSSRIIFLFVSIILVGLGYIFIVPPFENFDEDVHFSKIRQAYFLNEQFKINEKNIDLNIIEYQGPRPYSNGTPPFDSHLTYNKFFNHNDSSEFLKNYKENSFNNSYKASDEINWQHQHPPLFYIANAFFYKHLTNLSLVSQVNSLRIFSFFIFLLGLGICFYCFANIEGLKKFQHSVFIYPILFPMLFIQFARIGNDSLIFLLFSLIFLLFIKWFFGGKGVKPPIFILLSIVSGIGLLVKAFFVPIFLSLVISMVMIERKLIIQKNFFLLLLFPYIGIFLVWGYFNHKINNDFGLGVEFNELISSDANNLLGNMSYDKLIKGILTPLVTFSWSGTLSLTRIPTVMQLFMLTPLLFIFYVSTKKIINKFNSCHLFWTAYIFIIIFYIFLEGHVVINMLLGGPGASAGWYLHIFFPFICIIIGSCFRKTKNIKTINIQKYLVLIFVFFHIILLWFLLTLYGGCSLKLPNKSFGFDNSFCMANIDVIINNINVTNYATIGLIFWFMGIFLLYYLAVKELNNK